MVCLYSLKCVFAHARARAHGSKKKVLDPWELELGGCEPLNMGAEN